MKPLQVDFPPWFRLRPLTYTIIFSTFFGGLWLWLGPDDFFGLATTLGIFVITSSFADTLLDSFDTGPLQMSETLIRRQSLSGTFEIKWDEVERIERPTRGMRWIIFHGKDKLLAVSGPDLWSGHDREAMMALFEQQIEKRGIRVALVQNGTWKTAKNTKVKAKRQTIGSEL